MIERQIIIGGITSTEYLKQIHSFWDIQFIESATAKRIATWVWEYYDKYQKAPGRDIEGIFYKKLKNGEIQKDSAEEFEQDILPSLSAEYEQQSFNLDYLLEETKKHFCDRHLQIHTESIEALRATGNLLEAEEMAHNFKSLGISTKSIDKHISSLNKIKEKKKPRPIMLLKPWLKEGQTTIIYGNYGSGKSLLIITIAYLLGLKDFDADDCEIGEWQVKQPTGTLYIDGELGEQEMEERISQFEWLGRQQGKYRMRILSIPEYQMATEDTFYLSNRENQLKIIQWLKKHPNYKLLILDSASTLFGLKEENDNSEWSTKINPLIRDLRTLGVACLLLHHSGKDGRRGLRGASAMGAMAHNIFSLKNHTSKDIDKGQAWFTLSKDKQRSAGFSFKTFSLKYEQNEEQTETHWEVTDNY